MNKLTAVAGALAIATIVATPALATNYTVEMKNKGPEGIMVFEPGLTKVVPGDTVTFVATNKGHDAETIKGLIPDGATPFKGKIGKDITVTFDTPGVYAIKCTPHYALGMVALVVVGDTPDNLDAIESAAYPKRAKQRILADLKALSD